MSDPNQAVPGMPPLGGQPPAGMMPPMGEGMGMPSMGDEFNLNLDPTEAPISEYTPIDDGVYRLFASEVDVVSTEAGEPMVVVMWAVEDHAKFAGRKVRESFVIPGAARRNEMTKDNRNKWSVMMGMVREKLEGITGREWRMSDMKLNPKRDLSGAVVMAQVGHETWNNQNTGKSGIQNTIVRYLNSAPSPSQQGMMAAASGTPAAQMGVPPQMFGQPAAASNPGGFKL